MIASGTALITRFLLWWGSELSALVPQGLWTAFVGRRQRVIIWVGEEVAQVQLCRRNILRDLGSIPFHGDRRGAEDEACPEVLASFRTRDVDVVVRLPRKAALRRAVELPLAALENLREVIGFEIDRHTPFRANDVYFDYSLMSKDSSTNRVVVDLVVVTRKVAGGVISKLRGWGVEPDRLEVEGDDSMDINLLPVSPNQRAGRSGPWFLILAAMGLCILAGTVIYLPLYQKQDVIAQTEARLELARTEAAVAKEMKERAEQLAETGTFVVEKKLLRPTVAEVFSTLTDLLPDDTWVIQLSWSGERLTVAGYSSSSSSLIATLEAAALFSDVQFSSPVTTDQRIGLERFNLTAKVQGRADS